MTDADVTAFIEEFHVPAHVRRHCAEVARFATELAEKLKQKGENIDSGKVRHAALLHDVVRVIDFREFNPKSFPDPAREEDIEFWKMLREKYKGMHHAIAGAQILEERGFHDIASIVQKHRYMQIKNGFDTWEEKLVYYADKRVKHDKIVDLKERLDDGRRRNVPEQNENSAREFDEKIFALEREIYSKIGTTPPQQAD